MKNRILYPLCLLGFVCCDRQRHNYLTEEEKLQGWELLFDGTTLAGWKDFNGDSITGPWEVQNGKIRALGGGNDANGYLVTACEYDNFEIRWDWRISQGGNSGLLYHVVEGDHLSVPYVTGPEFQLIDDDNFEVPLEAWQRCGADYAMHLPTPQQHINPPGEWNSSAIVFDHGLVSYYMNGEQTLAFEAWSDDWYQRKNSGKWGHAPEYGLSRKGVFCLQDHGYPAWFRNIKVRRLPRKNQEVTLFNGFDLSGWEVYGNEQWYVEDGLLVCESGQEKQYGYLATRQYYDDFDLTLEFRQLSDGNSGVFIRSIIEPEVKVRGWQVEVAPKGKDTGGIYESYGRGWLSQIPDEKEEILKETDWNNMRIVAKGDSVMTWLNGELMTALEDQKIGAGKGRIALQIHDGGGIKVQWRNIRLTTL